MQATAHYHLVLHPGSDAGAFEALFADDGLKGALQSTRITSGFDTRLLRATDDTAEPDGDPASEAGRRYVWEVNVTLMTSAGYRFARNIRGLQEGVAELATVYRLDTFAPVSP